MEDILPVLHILHAFYQCCLIQRVFSKFWDTPLHFQVEMYQRHRGI